MSETTTPVETIESPEDHLARIFTTLEADTYGEHSDDIRFLLACVSNLHEEGTQVSQVAAMQGAALRALIKAADDSSSKPLANLIDAVLQGAGLMPEGESVLPHLTSDEEGLVAVQNGLVVPGRTPNRAERRAAARKSGK